VAARGGGAGTRGQSMAEFALVMPVLLMIVLGTLDLGRLFYSYVTITSAARVAANYAGANPNAWNEPDYQARVLDEGLGSLGGFCTVPSPAVPAPVFSDSAVDLNSTPMDVGDHAAVTISCEFVSVTPLLGSVLGGLDLQSTAVFPIRQGPLEL
jgi:Flp pilus assembly protein TadG